MSDNLMDLVKNGLQGKNANVKDAVNITKSASPPGGKLKELNVLNIKPKHANLSPLTETEAAKDPKSANPEHWEVIKAIMDSGCTVPVINPSTGRAYSVEESEASRNGVEYECANNETLPDLGQKRMAVITEEGTLRGYGTNCADVGKSLQSVRHCVHSKHAVCFGLGPEGQDHLIINRQTGEINRMHDDGINYIQYLKVVPPDQVLAVQEAMHGGQQERGPSGGSDFPRRDP